MATKTEIYNSALGKLGVKTVTSLTEDSDQRRALDTQYEQAVKATLMAYGWRFATKRVELAEDATAPVFEFENRFALPSDHLRTLSVWNGVKDADIVWEEEDGYILTDEDTFYIKYTYYQNDETKYTGIFTTSLSYKLAALTCISLRQSRTLAEDLETMFRQTVNEASVQDAKSRSRRTNKRGSTWLSARTTPVKSFVNVIKVT